MNLLKNNAKINEIEGKIASIINLATTAALNVVENKISNVSDLIKKIDYDENIKDIEGKYFTTPDYNKFTDNILDVKITHTHKKLMNLILLISKKIQNRY